MSQSPAIDYKEKYEAAMLQIEDLQGKLMQLTHQLGQLQRMIFGTKSERYMPENPAILQPSLFNQEPEGVSCSVMNTQTVSYVKTKTTSEPKPHPGRMKLPEALRRETVVLEPHEDVTQGKKIGEDITEILEWNPGELFVKRFVRPKYVVKAVDPDPACDTRIVMAELPERPLERCMAGPGLLAQIIADKYLDRATCKVACLIVPPLTGSGTCFSVNSSLLRHAWLATAKCEARRTTCRIANKQSPQRATSRKNHIASI